MHHPPVSSTTLAPEKPLLRGVSHEIAAGVALAAWVALALLAPSGRARLAANVYAFPEGLTGHQHGVAEPAEAFQQKRA